MSLRLRELPEAERRTASDALSHGRVVMALRRGGTWQVAVLDEDDEDSVASYETLGYVQVNDAPQPLREGTRFVHLQGLGRVPARMVREIQPGDLLSWNYTPQGYEVISIEPISAHYYSVVSKELKTGKEFKQKLKRDKLVGVTRP